MNTDKTSVASDLRYMVGTHGDPDYLVIAQNGDVALGIKPLFQADSSHAVSFMGLRLRSARVKQKAKAVQTPDGAAKFPTPMPLDQAWPNIQWDKKDNYRCSVVIGTMINKGVNDFPKVIDTIDKADIIGRFCHFVGQLVASEHFVVASDTLKSWLTMQFEKVLDLYLQLYNQTVPIKTHQLVSGNVIDFAGALQQQLEAAGIDTMILHKAKNSLGIPTFHENAAGAVLDAEDEDEDLFQKPTVASDQPADPNDE